MCGGIRYEISEPPISAGYCHCTRCQRAAPALPRRRPHASRPAAARSAGRGAAAHVEARRRVGKAYCSACGSHMWSEHPDDPEIRAVRLGSVDGDPGIRPSYRQFTAYAAAWEPIPDDGPRDSASAVPAKTRRWRRHTTRPSAKPPAQRRLRPRKGGIRRGRAATATGEGVGVWPRLRRSEAGLEARSAWNAVELRAREQLAEVLARLLACVSGMRQPRQHRARHCHLEHVTPGIQVGRRVDCAVVVKVKELARVDLEVQVRQRVKASPVLPM